MTTNIHNPEFQSQENNQESSYFLVIPAHLAEDDNLNHRQIILFAHLTGLSNKNGYSYASNEYLMKKVKVSETQIQKDLKFLEDCGYIRRQIIKNGMYTSRKIYITYAFSKNSYEYAQGAYRHLQLGGVRHLCTEAHKEEEEKKEEKKRERKRPLPKVKKELFEKFGEYGHLKLKPAEISKLIEKYGKERIDDSILKSDRWLETTGKKYKNYYTFLLGWIEREWTKKPTDDLQEKIKYTEQVKEELSKISQENNPAGFYIDISPTYCEIRDKKFRGSPLAISFLKCSIYELKNTIDKELRKRNIVLKI